MEKFSHRDARGGAVLGTLDGVGSRPWWCDPYILVLFTLILRSGWGLCLPFYISKNNILLLSFPEKMNLDLLSQLSKMIKNVNI